MLTAIEQPAGFEGELLRPGDVAYDDARRVWNGAIDRRPAVIARCTSARDVVTALRFARERELEVAVRGGGHGVAGYAVCDGGLVVDLSPMRGVRVDPEARVARVQGGALLGDLDGAAQAFGLATPAGIVTHTGVAGLTLGGGIGWLTRTLGATVDSLRATRVVTADGGTVTASGDENPDLFWGLRGGGGNFGIVTEFEFDLHPVGPIVLAGPVYYPLEDGAEVLRRYRDVVADAPGELMTILHLRRAPALPLLPETLHGRPVVAVVSCWSGELAQGEQAVRPLRELGTPLADLVRPRPFLELQGLFDAAVPHGWHYYWKSLETPPLTNGTIDVLVDHTERITSPHSFTIVFHLGGALARVPQDATAYPQRDAAFDVNITTAWLEGDERAHEHISWTRAFHNALEPHTGGRVYVNFLGDEGQTRVRAAYGKGKYARLQAIKRRWDPDNVFHRNQNIAPSAEPTS
jgi:FAD/FMN-containing dehydrogenase